MQSIFVRVRPAALAVLFAMAMAACTSSNPTDVESDAAKPARLEVSPLRIDFGSEGSISSVTLENAGTRAIEWTASENVGWLSLGASAGTMFPGATRNVPVSVQRNALTPGTHTATFKVSGARGAGSETVSVSVTMPAPSQPDPSQPARLEVAPLQVDFGTTATSASVTLKNTGDSLLTWTANESAGWLALGATSGSLAARSSKTLALSATRTGMSPGTYTTDLAISSGVAGSVTESVTMTVPEPQDPEPEDPEPEDPDPTSSVLLSGTLVDQFTGQALAGISVRYAGRNATTNAAGFFSIAGEPTATWSELTLSGAGIYSRRTYARSGETRWQAVPGLFSMSAFNDVARDEWAPHTVRWTSRPTVYVDARPEGFQGGENLEQWISEVRTQAAGFVSSWSGGTVRPADIIVTSNPPRDFTAGTIVIHFSESSSDYGNSSSAIGYAMLAWSREGSISGSAVWLRYVRYADRPSKRMGILGHELGHAMGMGHMNGATVSFMAPSIGGNTDLHDFDRQAAGLLYSRAPGNTSPDTDSSYSTSGSLAPSAVAGVSEWVCRDEAERP